MDLAGGDRMKKLSVGWLLLIAWGGLMVSCANPVASNERSTLDTLRRLDDFPFYEMHYLGDYGFAEYLERGGGAVEGGNLYRSTHVDQRWACTGFAALGEAGEKLVGRNFDWYHHPALVLFTHPPDGYASVSMVDISYLGIGEQFPDEEKQQALLRAPFLPFDGMNENGLAVGMMAVAHAEGGHDAQKMTLDDLEVIRLLLDYARDVPEAIELLQKYNVRFGEVPLHYLVADRQGNSAVIEYLGDEMQVITNTQPWQVSTNFVISEQNPVGSYSSCWRYNTAYASLEEKGGSLTSDAAMELLSAVSQSGDYPTIWSVVYNLSQGEVRIVIDRRYQQVYSFDLVEGSEP
jgi:hypothetical protein